MTKLDRLIKHYKKIAKTGTPLQAHYALGVCDALAAVKELADEWRADMKRYWPDRADPGYRALHDHTTAAWTAITNLECRTELNMERTAKSEANRKP